PGPRGHRARVGGPDQRRAGRPGPEHRLRPEGRRLGPVLGLHQRRQHGQPAVKLAVTIEHACAVTSSNFVYCCGNDNTFGQLGNGSTALAPTSAPALVPLNSLAGVGRLALGPETICLVDSTGHATCWGDNSAGTFGNGSTTSSLTPVSAAVGLGAIVDL